MEYYDVIIIGAGIAGCGLAYNLKRIGYRGKTLIIDKKEIGTNAGYGYRNTFQETIEEYNLPYHHKYKGVILGSLKEQIVKIDSPFYLINYSKTCKILLEKSDSKFKKEEVITFSKNKLKTNKSIYKFQYLIDCSGPHMFMKKKLRMKLPIRYFVGELFETENKEKLSDDYFYFNIDNDYFLEDIYPLGKKLLYGTWKYTKKIDFKEIHPIPKESYQRKNSIKIDNQGKSYAIQTVSPAFPLFYKNFAFLGDSFGTATPSAGEGISPILESSIMLATALKNKNLKIYDILWKKRFLSLYLKHLSLKISGKQRIDSIKIFKNNNKIILSMLKNENIVIPAEIKKKIPVKNIIFQIYNLLRLQTRYLLTNRI